MQVEQRVLQRARDAAASLEPNGRERDQILRGKRDKSPLVLAFARFEASLPSSAPVDRDAAEARAIALIKGVYACAGIAPPLWFIDGTPPEMWRGSDGFMFRAIVAALTPSVLAESTSNDCLLVAEAVRERCVEAAEKLVRFDRKNGDEQQRARADAFQAGQRHAAQEIRSLDLSGVGVG